MVLGLDPCCCLKRTASMTQCQVYTLITLSRLLWVNTESMQRMFQSMCCNMNTPTWLGSREAAHLCSKRVAQTVESDCDWRTLIPVSLFIYSLRIRLLSVPRSSLQLYILSRVCSEVRVYLFHSLFSYILPRICWSLASLFLILSPHNLALSVFAPSPSLSQHARPCLSPLRRRRTSLCCADSPVPMLKQAPWLFKSISYSQTS